MSSPTGPRLDNPAIALALRLGLYFLVGFGVIVLAPPLLLPLGGVLLSATFTVFFAAVAANFFTLRVFERGHLSDCGLGWTPISWRELLLGIALGAAFASFVVVIPLLFRQAHLEAVAASDHLAASLGLLFFSLLFGAFGEELLFHGYAFQLLADKQGRFAAIIPVALLFGLVHSGNHGANGLGILNTMLWGGLLGYACVRTGALWLPIGIHFGWNVAFPLWGADLSGFTMGVTGYALRWTGNQLWSGGEYGPEGGILTTVAALALMFVLNPVLGKLIPEQE